MVMGAYMAAAFLLQAIGGGSVLPALLSELMVICVPVVAYTLMKRGYRQHPAERPFSTLWMHGITIFLCGSLILGIVQYVYTRFVNPMFITQIAQSAADAYMSLPGENYRHFGQTMQQIIDKHLLPTPIGFAFSVIWLVSFSGCMISLVITAIIKLIYKKRR